MTTTLTATEMQSLPAGRRRWEESSGHPGCHSGNGLLGCFAARIGPAACRCDRGRRKHSPGFVGWRAHRARAASQQQRQGCSEPSGMGQAWAGGRGFALAESAIRQVQTRSGNVSANGARAAGGRMNLETQEESAQVYHGQAFFFDRQNTWGARNPFTAWVQQTAPATTTAVPVFAAQPFSPPDHESSWGLGVGSHIRRDKLFWFAALDRPTTTNPAVSMLKHPYLETTGN